VQQQQQQGVRLQQQVEVQQQGVPQVPPHLRPLICLVAVAVLLLVLVAVLQQGARGAPWTSCVATRSFSC
jgi:hypothetical protein